MAVPEGCERLQRKESLAEGGTGHNWKTVSFDLQATKVRHELEHRIHNESVLIIRSPLQSGAMCVKQMDSTISSNAYPEDCNNVAKIVLCKLLTTHTDLHGWKYQMTQGSTPV